MEDESILQNVIIGRKTKELMDKKSKIDCLKTSIEDLKHETQSLTEKEKKENALCICQVK